MANYNGTSGADTFTGGADNDTAVGNGGNDALSGGGGNDLLVGNAGADTLAGGDGDDRLFSGDETPPFNLPYYGNPYTPPLLDTGSEADTLNGGAGDDALFAGYGDNVDGGTNGVFGDRLFISFMGASSGVAADFRLASQVIGGGTITGIENISWVQGSNFDDVINVGTSTGNGYSDFTAVFGMGGNDRLVAGYYTGTLFGGDGNDIVDGRGSQYLQSVDGGAGDDTLYTNSNSFATAYGGGGSDTIYSHGTTYGGAGNDLIILSFTYYGGVVYGEDGNDEIRAASSGTTMAGGSGADTLTGDAGNDSIYSADILNGFTPLDDMGLERDVLNGFGGDDTLAAGYGDDIDGGSGNDTLRYSLGGLTSGITFSTAAFVAGQPFTLGGGTVNGIEALAYLRGTNFGDTLTLATQATMLTVDAAGGNDLISWGSSSVSVNGGDGDDRFIDNVAGDVLDGGAGIDTIDYRNAAAGVTVALALVEGQAGSGPNGDQLRNFENIDGSSRGDNLTGNDAANVLKGMAGDDTINGRGGDDLLSGGLGKDTLIGGSGADKFIYSVIGDSTSSNFDILSDFAPGIDKIDLTDITVKSISLRQGSDASAAVYTMVTVQADGGAMTIRVNAAITLFDILYVPEEPGRQVYGSSGDDLLVGGTGNDLLVGGGGADVMDGSAGSDLYYADNIRDRVYDPAGGGSDRIFASASHVLIAGQEIETLSTNANAGTAAIDLTGNEFGQSIYGNDGANLISGQGGDDYLLGLGGNDRIFGGTGDDIMGGGTGDDLFYVDSLRDRIYEAAGEGSDRVFASASHALIVGQEIETLSTDWSGGTAAIDLTGNEFGQSIYGNDGANLISGQGGDDYLLGLGGNDRIFGGTGNDIMGGDAGDDLFYVDAARDRVYDSVGQGNDRVFASASHALIVGQEIETLSTDWSGGTTAIDLTGNEFSQSIYGNDGANLISGQGGDDYLLGLGGNDTLVGGTGNDIMSGGTGDDYYYVDAASDRAYETAGQGNDRVFAGTSHALIAGQEVETLSTDSSVSIAAINLTGNEFSQSIYGNDGANLIDGQGGDDLLLGLGGNDQIFGGGGVDLMYGGAGDDLYYVDAPGDRAYETAGQGDDRVFAGTSHALLAGQEIETLSTDWSAGTAQINLTGNEFAQNIYGNAGLNFIDGKDGADYLLGGDGGDIFAFTTGLGTTNVDGIADFASGVDRICLDDAVFTGLGTGTLAANLFVVGTTAGDADDRILYDSATGALFYDADGNGAGGAIQFASLGAGVLLSASDVFVI
jgi:Ca2+-binding RTX toxin-like protein